MGYLYNPSMGIPKNHYSNSEIMKDRKHNILTNNNRTLGRQERRKYKRHLDKIAKKYGGYVEEY